MPESKMSAVLSEALSHMRTLADADTIIGKPIETPYATIVPVSKISIGFGVGGSDVDNNNNKSGTPAASDESMRNAVFAGGTGGGVSVSPLGFLVIRDADVQFISVDTGSDPMGKLIEQIPTLWNSVKELFPKKSDDNNKKQDNSNE